MGDFQPQDNIPNNSISEWQGHLPMNLALEFTAFFGLISEITVLSMTQVESRLYSTREGCGCVVGLEGY
jgi:hypothetical protein